MKRYVILLMALVGTVLAAQAQQEYYADPYVGLPEFRLLPLRLATPYTDSVKVEVHLRIVYDDLQFVKSDDHYQARYSLDLSLDKSKGVRVGAQHLDRTISALNFAETNSRLLSDHTVISFTQKPDLYSLHVVLTDNESRQERSLDKEISFPAKEWAPQLRLSDLVPLDSSGSVQMTMGLLTGQPLRAAFNLYSDSPEPPQVEYQVHNEKNVVIASGNLSLESGQNFHADTLTIPAAAFSGVNHRLIVKAHIPGLDLARAFTVKAISENLPDYVENLDLAIRQLKYLAEPLEIQRMTLAPPWRREEMFLEFWKKKDPNPVTSNNERMDEYYRRVKYANLHFKGLRDGWETDMGRVYVIFGQPTDVERHPFDIDKKPYEFWSYDDLNRRFLFVDEDGFGDFRLKSPLLTGH